MNPNDLLAQQQSVLNQYLQNVHHMEIGVLAVYLALTILAGWVIYMFYACFRRIEDEIRNFRIAYEFAHPPEQKARNRNDGGSQAELGNPFSKGSGDGKYVPKA